MPEISSSMGEELINALLKRDRTSSNLQTALAIAVSESHVKLSRELSHQLIFGIREAGNIPFDLGESDPEDLHVRVEALCMIFKQMITFIMAYVRTQGKDHLLEQRIEKIAARYGIKAPWDEDPRDSIN